MAAWAHPSPICNLQGSSSELGVSLERTNPVMLQAEKKERKNKSRIEARRKDGTVEKQK